MKVILTVCGLASLLCATQALALDVMPSGEFQVQAVYHQPAIENDSHWSMAMPDTKIGVIAVEQLENSAFIGHISMGIDPLSDSTTYALTAQEAYLSWQQGPINLWAGRLPSLEKTYLQTPFIGQMSLAHKGLHSQGFYTQIENQAVRLEFTSGDYLTLAGQWIIDETTTGTPWSVATKVQTNEGQLSVTYQKQGDSPALWGNQISWLSDRSMLSGVWMKQGDDFAWDVEIRMLAQTNNPFLSYGKDENDASRWSAGIQQSLSESVTNFSELVWWPDQESWKWATGFELKY